MPPTSSAAFSLLEMELTWLDLMMGSSLNPPAPLQAAMETQAASGVPIAELKDTMEDKSIIKWEMSDMRNYNRMCGRITTNTWNNINARTPNLYIYFHKQNHLLDGDWNTITLSCSKNSTLYSPLLQPAFLLCRERFLSFSWRGSSQIIRLQWSLWQRNLQPKSSQVRPVNSPH